MNHAAIQAEGAAHAEPLGRRGAWCSGCSKEPVWPEQRHELLADEAGT